MGDKTCPFCNAEPRSIRSQYPDAKDDSVTCPTYGCPAGGTWVRRSIWNTRTEAPADFEANARELLFPRVASDQ